MWLGSDEAPLSELQMVVLVISLCGGLEDQESSLCSLLCCEGFFFGGGADEEIR